MQAMTFLEMVLEEKRRILAGLKEKVPIRELEDTIKGVKKRPFFKRFSERSHEEVRIIGEIKRASPSKGMLISPLPMEKLLDAYKEGGAYAISVITEERYFHGSLGLITEAKKRGDLPVLRKDFIVDPYEIYESKALGADAILLIGEALAQEELKEYLELSKELDIDVLLEVHSLKTYEKVADLEGFVLGINNRDLKSLKVDISRGYEVLANIPYDMPVIIESGIEKRQDVLGFLDKGVSGFLIGTALVLSEDPVKKLWEIRGFNGSKGQDMRDH